MLLRWSGKFGAVWTVAPDSKPTNQSDIWMNSILFDTYTYIMHPNLWDSS